MEFASYLAGEAWSDHPACTHAGLAHLARMVNDCTSDEARGRLAPLIPSVIGLTSDDPRLDVILALRATAAALPIAAEDRQRSLAVGALVCLNALERMGGSAGIDVDAQMRAAFDAAPAAARWARTFISAHLRREPAVIPPRHSHSIIAAAVDGIASACVNDQDNRLYLLLSAAIDDCIAFTAHGMDVSAPARATAPPDEGAVTVVHHFRRSVRSRA
ncbi:hypothetical protein [Glaciibacter sp. 2TAF33]|uniref:hypothetical protein n=1 Tax=Glaciibacter sp. 2TAF33 TaxID=3233015 RepID=UPI003F8DD8DF